MSGSARLGINCALSTFHSWRIEHLFTELMKNEIFFERSTEPARKFTIQPLTCKMSF